MSQILKLLSQGVTLVAICLVASSCAPKAQNTPQPPLTEAYRLMDKGQNEKAAILLEDFVGTNPDSEEAKVLLASAYMGEAGVDIYKLYASFKDIVFNESLSQRFWGTGKDSSTDDLFGDPSSTGATLSFDLANHPEVPPVEILIGHLDSVLLQSKKIVEFLNRFPDVPKDKWPLLDSGLATLESAGNERDLCLYRIFFRVIYMKAYIGQEILRDPDVGRKKWLCAIDLGNLRESLNWVLKQTSAASEDFRRAYPSKGSNLNSVQAIADAVKVELDGLDHSTTGGNTELTVLQSRFRSELRCDQ